MTSSDSWDHTVAQRSYRYVRASLIGLFVALTTAVVAQSIKQGGLLTSISAYYYTPAQAIFVGALVAIGTAMIALRGATTLEEVALNIGGMFAPVIAIVPTSRGEDFRAAVTACRSTDETMLSGRVGTTLDCPTVTALRDATRDNVQNNMIALLVLGGLALVTAVVISAIEKKVVGAEAYPDEEARGFRIGFVVATALYLVALVAFLVDLDRFIDTAHFTSAIGLFACILLVVIANGWRKQRTATVATRADGGAPQGLRAALTGAGRLYFALATTMVITAVVLGLLVALGAVTLFWLEAALILLFVLFWATQTKDTWDPDRRPGTSSASA